MKIAWVLANIIYAVFIASVILMVTPFGLTDWQFWAMSVSIPIVGMKVADVKRS